MIFNLVYPERRKVSHEQIIMWYYDAVYNDEISEEYLNAEDPLDMAHGLSDAGFITFDTPDETS